MTEKVDRISEHEKIALRNRLTSVLADAGLSDFIPPDFVSVTDEGVSFAPISFYSARRLTNQLTNLTVTTGAALAIDEGQTNTRQLQIAFEECHAIPTGLSPALFLNGGPT